MHKHIERILEEAEEDMKCIDETPAANHLFTLKEDVDTLMGTQSDLSRTLVAKIFLSAASQYLTSIRH